VRTAPLLLSVALVACGDDPSDDGFGQCNEMIRETPVVLRAEMDLVLVVANASSMSEEQTALADEMGRLVERLTAAPLGFLPDLHIGVLSDDGGGLEVPDGCPELSGGGDFIIDELVDEFTGTRSFNHSVELGDQLACMVQLGTSGSAVSRPLAGLAAALEDGSGFRRPAVPLAVAIVTDGEDLSPEDVASYAQRVGKNAPAGTYVSVVSGGVEGCAVDGFTDAAAAPRLIEFAAAFGEHGAAVSLCGEEPLLGGLTGMLWRVPVAACLDPALGDAPDCRVSDVRNLDRDDQQEFPITSCDDSERPCFEIGDNDCGAPSSGAHLHLVVDRGSTPPPDDTVPVARCRLPSACP
jgi:hypothetical protein